MAELKKSEACGKGHRWSAESHMKPSLFTVESLVATLQSGWLVGGPGSRGEGVSGVLLQTVEQRRNMIAKVLWSHREPVRMIYCHQFRHFFLSRGFRLQVCVEPSPLEGRLAGDLSLIFTGIRCSHPPSGQEESSLSPQCLRASDVLQAADLNKNNS